jgi:hypothetical protein
MKILKRKETNIVTTAMTETSIEENGTIRCDDTIYADCTLENCEVIDNVTLPNKFVGGCYTYTDGVWACVNTKQVELVYPVPVITMRQARLCLLNRSLLDDVELAMSGMTKAAQIEWEYSVEVKRDYPLVVELGNLLGLSETDLDAFFDDAKLI